MQATSRPWTWLDWRAAEGPRRKGREGREGRRVRLRLADLQLRPLKLDWRPDLHAAFYTPSQIRHLIRLEAAAMGALPTLPTVPPWLGDPVRPGKIPDLAVKLEQRPTLSSLPMDAITDTSGSGSGSGWWSGAARGLPLGAAMLALLLLILRVADSCLHTGFLKFPRRRQSEEWTTPSVMATNLAVHTPSEASDSELPPPYSEAVAPKPSEEPPPPYSVCHIKYVCDNCAPSVQVYTSSQRARMIGYSDTEPPDGTSANEYYADVCEVARLNNERMEREEENEEQNETAATCRNMSATEIENSTDIQLTSSERDSNLVV